MLDQKDLQAMAELMDLKLKPIEQRLDRLQEDIDLLREESSITRHSVNLLLEGTKDASIEVKVPLFKKAE